MSKRVSNKSGKQRRRPGRSDAPVEKWVKRKSKKFDPLEAIDSLLGKS